MKTWMPLAVRNYDLQVISAAVLKNVVRKSLGGHSHRVLVHSVGAHAHDAAQSAGAEFQVLVESVFKCRGIFVAELEDLHFGGLVEVSFEPTLYFCFKFFHIS